MFDVKVNDEAINVFTQAIFKHKPYERVDQRKPCC